MKINFKTKAKGFTLMEIMVATVIFAIAVTSLMALFNYVLKINRKTEALRQASQGMRDFVEYLVKQVRNGQIDYYPYGQSGNYGTGPCQKNVTLDPLTTVNFYSNVSNRLEIIDTDNVQQCIYYAKPGENYDASKLEIPSGALFIKKSSLAVEQNLNPPNFSIESLRFIIRPLCDPYAPNCAGGNDYQAIQPMVTMVMKFLVKLPTGEQIPINYQTSVSSNKYDIPNKLN